MTETIGGGNVRAFVAVELDGEARAALGSLQDGLQRAPLAHLGRWVAPEGIHLTLKFLGDVPAARLPDLRQAIERAGQGIAPFALALGRLGCFPNLSSPRVIWVGIEEPTGTLVRLQLAVEREMSRLGFRPEGRPYRPHLTLARVRDRASSQERTRIGAWIRAQAIGHLASMEVAEVALMRSVLCADGAIYSRLGAAPLQPVEA